MPTEFDVFKDRMESLLFRWERFQKRAPNVSPQRIIKACLGEMLDNYTVRLMDDPDFTGTDVPWAYFESAARAAAPNGELVDSTFMDDGTIVMVFALSDGTVVTHTYGPAYNVSVIES